MKIRPRIVTIAVLTLMSAAACVAALRAPESEIPAVDNEKSQAAAYYLRDCDGFIAVYKGASSTPIDITDIETATLNDTDAELIRSGIPADSRNELLMLLEDLGS